MGYLDDIDEYGWNPQTGQIGGGGAPSSGVLLSPGVGWNGDSFVRPDGGLINMGKTSAGTNFSNTIVNGNDGWLGGNSLWGRNGVLPTVFQGLSAVGGLMQAYTGLKQLQFAREQLDASKDAFRTQFEANRTALADSARNAASTNYAAHHGLARSFNQDEQRQVADNEYNRVRDSYKSYV